MVQIQLGTIIDGLNKMLGTVGKPISDAWVNSFFELCSANPSLLYGNNTPEPGSIGNPIEVIRRMFNGGRWLNTFELPFFKETYLVSNQYDGWKMGGVKSQMGDKLGEIMKTGLSMDFPTTPVFAIDSMDKTGYDTENLTFSFYLINKSTEWLERNFRFLHAFYAGSQWLSLTGRIYKKS